MSRPLKEGKVWTLAALLSFPAYLVPIANPDLFWHLSAARWMAAHDALPRADWLSFSRAGVPWLDFEWLSQLVFAVFYKLGGFFALWLLKGLCLLAVWLLVNEALRRRDVPSRARAACLLIWSTSALMHADIRPELFSLIGFALCLLALEEIRARKLKVSVPLLCAAALVFGLWSNVHLGFIAGLVLIGLYAVVGGSIECGKLLAAAALGSLINPYGVGPYKVAWEHWLAGSELSRYILEWQPMWATRNPVFWLFWPLLVAAAAAAITLFRRGERAPALAALGLAAGALSHERGASFFNIAAVYALGLGFARRERSLVALAAACGLFGLWTASRLEKRVLFDDRFVPRETTAYIEAQKEAFVPLRVYNPWEWGGYLGWRLSPWYRVFEDGRYFFHDELPREAAAVADFAKWKDFVASERFDALLLQNLPKYFPTTKVYPDGSKKEFDRPYYLFYAPRESWALVHWDDIALVFVRRDAVPSVWLEAHEYRYLRPHDDAAFAEAMSLGQIPKSIVNAESLRHQREMLELVYRR